jgi:predicted DNA-binding protein
MSTTVATNIRLPEELLKALKHKAVEERKSLNQMIREAVEAALHYAPDSKGTEKDAFEEVIGIGRSGIKDGSSKHDQYLYGIQG